MTIEKGKLKKLVEGTTDQAGFSPVEVIESPGKAFTTPTIEVASATMKKLDPDTISGLNLPNIDTPLVTSGIRTDADGSKEVIYLLRTAEGSVFELPPENGLLQELQITAASAAIDSMEAQTPIQIASAIKKAINEYNGKGIMFNGSIFEAWDFAIQALEKMRDFQKVRLQVDQLNVLQAATKQLQLDQGLSMGSWLLLPPHRRKAAVIITEMTLASAIESTITSDTVNAAVRMKEISLTMAERNNELRTALVENYRDITLGIADETGKVAIGLVGELLSQAGDKTSELSQVLMKIVFGNKIGDEGALKGLLERSGDAGNKLMELIENSGLSIHNFFVKLFIGSGKGIEADEENKKDKRDNSPKQKNK